MIGGFRDKWPLRERGRGRTAEDLAELLDLGCIGLHWFDLEGKILGTNGAQVAMLGVPEEQFVGHNIREFYVDPPIIEEILGRLKAGESIQREPVRLGAKNGSVRDVIIDASVSNASGRRKYAQCLTRDITENKRSEVALSMLAAVVETSDDAIITKSLEGIIRSWNAGAERIFGYTAAEAIGQSINLIVPVDLRGEEQEILSRLKAGIRIDHYETTRLAKNGARLQISLSVSPIRDKSGEIIGASKVARDVTMRKNAEASARFLAKASASLANLVDFESTLERVAQLAVPEFADWCAVDLLEGDASLKRVAITHVDPEKVELAQRLRREMGPDQSKTNGVWRVIHSGRSELVPEITAEMIHASPATSEVKRIAIDLGLRSYMAVPLVIRGKVLGALTFVSAESGRRYSEDDLSLAEDLAHRASIAIENAQLYDEARRADRRKDEFLATLAHELRNPLAPIRSALALGRASGADPEMMGEIWNLLGRQVDQMVRLVDDLLDLSRINQDKLELRLSEVELAPIVEQAIEVVRPFAQHCSVFVEVERPLPSITMKVDPVRLGQVITNLTNNACKFSEAGSAVRVAVQKRDREVLISVIDSGVGIPSDKLQTIFEMFGQVESARERSRGGLGIGLALVKRIVELHGGSVSAASEGAGKGSEFTVRLPLHDFQSAAKPSAPAGSEPRASGFDILVVDDNVDAAFTMSAILRLAGNTVSSAHDGLEAVAMAEAHLPQVVLMDIGLPKLNGYDACRSIRNLAGGSQIFMVALTGWGQDEDRRMSKEAGFDQHLVKPVESRILLKLLEELRKSTGSEDA